MARYQRSAWIILFIASPALADQGRSPTTNSTLSVGSAQASSAARIASAYGTITSMHRSAAHNRAVGGVPNSYHLQGRAIDIVRKPGVTHRQIAASLTAAGFTLIESLDAGSHSHFAFAAPAAASQAALSSQARKDLVESVTDPRSASGGNSAKGRAILQPVAADDHGTLWIDDQLNAGLIEPERPIGAK